MTINRKINPKHLPYFPFYAASWLGSETVRGMTLTECGIYINLMAMCWQYGSVPWDDKRLARELGCDYRVIVRFMEKYSYLTQTLQEDSSKYPQTLLRPYSEVTIPKLQEFSETLGKNGRAQGQIRVDEGDRREDELDSSRQAATLPTLPSSSKGQTGENKPVGQTYQLPSDEEVSPAPKQSSSRYEATPAESASPTTPSDIKAVPLLSDIRDWPETEERFGILGTRLRNCIRYQLDVSSDGWYRDKAYPTVAKLNSEKFVTKLDADTPVAWTPDSAKTAPPGCSGQKYQTETPNFD